MAFCINCGAKLQDGANFCGNCGKAVNDNSSNKQRKTVYDGEIHKCPNCGELLNSFVTNCPACGYELRSVKTNSPIEALAKKVEAASSLDEKIELITNFYVPNTKEDIYDFFILAVSNLEDSNYDTDDAWRAKLEQTYHKAKISFGNANEFAYIDELYQKIRKKVSKREFPIFVKRNKSAFILALLVMAGIACAVIAIMLAGSIDPMVILAICLIVGGLCVAGIGEVATEAEKEKRAKNKMRDNKGTSNRMIPAGKDSNKFIQVNYKDVAEQLRVSGFKNIVLTAEKKGLLDTEGGVSSVSIAGSTDFSAYDEFDMNSRVIIHYYSKKYKKTLDTEYQ